MTTIIRPGEMTVIDDTVDPPVIVFDGDEKLLHATNGPVVGSITLPARTATIPNGQVNQQINVNVDAYYALAAAHPAANMVLGSFRMTTFGGTQGMAGIPGVFDAGGTIVHLQEGGLQTGSTAPSRVNVSTMASYTFLVSAGVLYLNERVFVSAPPNGVSVTRTRTLLSIRFDFKLYICALT